METGTKQDNSWVSDFQVSVSFEPQTQNWRLQDHLKAMPAFATQALRHTQTKWWVNPNKWILFIQTFRHQRYAGNLFAYWDLLSGHSGNIMRTLSFIVPVLSLVITQTRKSKIAGLEWQITFLKPANLNFLLFGIASRFSLILFEVV